MPIIGYDKICITRNGTINKFVIVRRYDPVRGMEENDVPLADNWVKVKYKGNTGYTFNAYLGPNRDQPKPSDYFVISPGENCGDQFFELKQYRCYGIYGSPPPNGQNTIPPPNPASCGRAPIPQKKSRIRRIARINAD